MSGLNRFDMFVYNRSNPEVMTLTMFVMHFIDMTQGKRVKMHDAATLQNHHKCLVVGANFMEPKYHQVLSICVGMGRIKDGTGSCLQNRIDDPIRRPFGRNTLEISHSLMQDRTALDVVKMYDQDVEAYSMHDVDKIGTSGIGDLVRSKNKKPINPFPEDQKLVSKMHNIAKYFSYGERWEKLVEVWINIHGVEIPTARLVLDLNTTRIMGNHGLLHSFLRQNKLLRMYMTQKPVHALDKTLFCFGGTITLFQCSVPLVRNPRYHHSTEFLKGVFCTHFSLYQTLFPSLQLRSELFFELFFRGGAELRTRNPGVRSSERSCIVICLGAQETKALVRSRC